MKIAIIDDEKDVTIEIESLLKEYSSKYNFEIMRFTDGLAFLNEEISSFNMLFVDIEMPTINGLDLVGKVVLDNSNIIIFYITTHTTCITKALNNNAFTFIPKPIIKDDFFMEITRALDLFNKRRYKLEVIWNSTVTLIDIESILYVESINKKCIIHTKGEGKYFSSKKLLQLIEILMPYNFSQAHKSYLINLDNIKNITKGKVSFSGCNQEIALSRKFKDIFIKKLNLFINEVSL